MLVRSVILAVAVAACACDPGEQSGVWGTVELGDNFVAPDLALDEDFFFCRIQPAVLTQHSCARGGSGEQGKCHDSRSALRLLDTDDPPPCDGGSLVGDLPDAYVTNLDAVRLFVQTDPLTSPLYLRPLRKASHPRRLFDENDEAAELLVEWISAGAR